MDKLWKLSEPKSDKLILIKNRIIYKGNPDREKVSKFSLDTDTPTNQETEKELFGIPYQYITKIINQEGIKHIEIFFGQDSEEELTIENEKTKNEIFQFLKDDFNELHYKSELPNFIMYCKASLFAILFLTGIFIWGMYYAIEIEQGTLFELRVRGRGSGLAGLIFLLGTLGKTKLIIGYIVLLGIALVSLFRKLRTRTEREVLYR